MPQSPPKQPPLNQHLCISPCSGHWKPLHYAVKQLYAPLTLVAHEEGGALHISAVSDLAQAAQLQLALHLLRYDDDGSTCDAARVVVEVLEQQVRCARWACMPGRHHACHYSGSCQGCCPLQAWIPGCSIDGMLMATRITTARAVCLWHTCLYQMARCEIMHTWPHAHRQLADVLL